MIDMPVRFPKDEDVIAEEAARFRALSPENRIRALGDCFRTYHFLIAASGRAEQLTKFAYEEERQGRAALQEFVARHG